MKKILVNIEDTLYEKLKQNGKISKQVRTALEKYLNENNNNSNTNSNEVNSEVNKSGL